MTEVWKDIPGFEGIYQVSDLARVRSLDRVTKGRKIKGREIFSSLRSDGYRNVSLWKEGKQTTKTLHKIVALTFIGPRPPGLYVCHENDDKTRNIAERLRYDTPTGNSQETIRLGTHPRLGSDQSGEKNGNVILDEIKVKEIRRLLDDGYKMKAVASKFGVSYSLIKRINRRELWDHVH